MNSWFCLGYLLELRVNLSIQQVGFNNITDRGRGIYLDTGTTPEKIQGYPGDIPYMVEVLMRYYNCV